MFLFAKVRVDHTDIVKCDINFFLYSSFLKTLPRCITSTSNKQNESGS